MARPKETRILFHEDIKVFLLKLIEAKGEIKISHSHARNMADYLNVFRRENLKGIDSELYTLTNNLTISEDQIERAFGDRKGGIGCSLNLANIICCALTGEYSNLNLFVTQFPEYKDSFEVIQRSGRFKGISALEESSLSIKKKNLTMKMEAETTTFQIDMTIGDLTRCLRTVYLGNTKFGSGTWIAKADTGGNTIWIKWILTHGYTYPQDYTMLADGCYLFAMAASDPPDSIKTEPNLGNLQSWVLKLDTNCQRLWDKTIFTTGHEQDAYVAQGTDGCYLVGNTNWDSIAGYMTQPQVNGMALQDYWVVKMCDTIISGINNVVDSKAKVSVYPNPFVSDIAITIQLQNAHQARVAIYNTLGQLFYDRTEYGIADTYTKMLSLGSLPNGLYFIEVTVDGQTVVKKVLRE